MASFLLFYSWTKRNVLVPRTSRVKDLLIHIKFLLALNNRTEVLSHPVETAGAN